MEKGNEYFFFSHDSAEARDQHLSVLLRDHEQRSQVEERAIRKEAAAEEARRRELERVRELQRRAREEAEAEASTTPSLF